MMDGQMTIFDKLLNDPMVDSFCISKSSSDMYRYRMQIRFIGDPPMKYMHFISMSSINQCFCQYIDEREKRLTMGFVSITTGEEFTNYMKNLGLKGNPK